MLIELGTIKAFQRRIGCLLIGLDKIWGRGGFYKGPERRTKEEYSPLALIYLAAIISYEKQKS